MLIRAFKVAAERRFSAVKDVILENNNGESWVMWDETKQRQLNELQRREAEGALTGEEKHLLEKLLYELEQDEWQRLNPALERLRGERIDLQENLGQTETQNAILAAIASRQDDLLRRAETQLKGLRSEHQALKTERERVLNETAV